MATLPSNTLTSSWPVFLIFILLLPNQKKKNARAELAMYEKSESVVILQQRDSPWKEKDSPKEKEKWGLSPFFTGSHLFKKSSLSPFFTATEKNVAVTFLKKVACCTSSIIR